MPRHKYIPLTDDRLQPDPALRETDWLWNGYLARGNITLLTSRWKAGKTTLLTGLLGRFAADSTFLDRPLRAAKAVVVSEESRRMWASRIATLPIGPHVRLLSRPFPGRPTPSDWRELVYDAEEMRLAGDLDLFVVDPLASFLPGHSDSDPGVLLELLQPLRRLAEYGVAILVLHHPRKERADEGSTARGSGTLLGFVDVILELHPYSSMRSDERRRRLVGFSRHPETPPAIVYEWVRGTTEFRCLGDPLARQFEDNWIQVRAILEARRVPVTHRELLEDWPPDQMKPARAQLYHWLNRAFAERLVKRTGNGTSADPYRFQLGQAGP
jgi:AAA domain